MTDHRHQRQPTSTHFVRTALLLAMTLLPIACRQLPQGTIGGGAPLSDPGALTTRAREAFTQRPRRVANVIRALEDMRGAAIATPPRADLFDARFDRLRDATHYAIWLARFGDDARRYATAAFRLGNTLVEHAPDRGESYYLRAVAAGLLADADASFGLDAMAQIQADAKRAIEIAPAVERGGPHRVLGALYLHAPGPPAGPGSTRRAIKQLEKAVEIGPDHPGNLMFLARALARASSDRDPRVKELTTRARTAIEAVSDADKFQVRAWRDALRDL